MSDTDDEDNEVVGEERFLLVTTKFSSVEVVPNYKDLITKVRKAVKIFKKSPTKNDIYLQKYVQEELGKNLELILDCKTRWNSLLSMVERFHNLRLCVSKALIDMESEIYFTDDEWSKINDLKLCLEPIKVGLEVICRRDSTLITAETTFKFILEKLDKRSTLLSTDLATALRKRIQQRRTDLSGVLVYLQNTSKYENECKNFKDTTFEMPKKSVIRKEIKNLLERVLIDTDTRENNSDDPEAFDYFEEDENIQEQDIRARAREDRRQSNISLQEELELQLQENCIEEAESKSKGLLEDIVKTIKKEMISFESDGKKGKYLCMAYEYLLTIRPTSVEAERAFSAAGYLCNDLRSRLQDSTINNLCFLRSYFQSITN